MCTQYWNLNEIKIKCPNCKKEMIWELQTHWMGEVGSCLNDYNLNEKISELKGIKEATLDGKNDCFIGECKNCGKFYDFGAKIKDESVIGVYLIGESQ